MEGLLSDFKFACRMLARNRRFAAVVVLTLAIGIGATTAVFNVADTLLLRAVPYQDADRLVLVSESLPQLHSDDIGVSAAEYRDYRERNRSFSDMAAFELAGFNLTGGREPSRVNAALVSASTFPMLGIMPELGRAFTADEEGKGRNDVAVISHELWKREFGGDRNVIGSTIRLDDKPRVVVGVMPDSFRFPSDGSPLSQRIDLWVPESIDPARFEERVKEFGVGLVARLKAGVTLEQAGADVRGIAEDFMQRYRNEYPDTVRVVPRVYELASHSAGKALTLILLLAIAVGSVLLIACANVANLLLAAGNRRAQEMAIRCALGASPGRLLRQFLVESLILSLLGSAVGMGVAYVCLRELRRFGPADLPRLQDLSLQPLAIVFAIGLALIVALFFALVPAWRTSKLDPQLALKGGSRGSIGTIRWQNWIATAEIAITLALLVCGGLLLRSFVHLLNAPAGFNTGGVFIVRTMFNPIGYASATKRQAMQRELLQRISSLPGVTAVGAASHLPLSDSRRIGFRLESSAPDAFNWAQNSLVTPGYFRAMGIALVAGRDFTEDDRPGTLPVAIVSQTLARTYFPNSDPIGQRLQWGDIATFTIIGVAGDVHVSALDADPPAMIYQSMLQLETGTGNRTAFVIRTDGSVPGIFAAVQRELWAVDRELPVYDGVSMSSLVAESLAQRRFTMLLLTGFGVAAVVMAAIGLFGVLSYLVAERTREFGIRIALGADKKDIYWQVAKRAVRITVMGSLAGLLGSVAVSRVLEANLYHVSRFDSATILSVLGLLGAVSLFAAYWPARRATRIDPISALRHY